MEHIATLKTSIPENLSHYLGVKCYGFIFGDKATYGNHPLREGAYIHTNRVKQVVIDEQGTFIVTDSDSVYKLESLEKVSLTGDPVNG